MRSGTMMAVFGFVVGLAIGCGSKPTEVLGDGGGGADSAPKPVAPAELPADADGWTTRRTPLLGERMPVPASPERFCLAPGGRRWAYVAKKFGALTLVVDGVEDPRSFPEIGELGFGPDGKDFGYFVYPPPRATYDLRGYVNGGEHREGRTPSAFKDPNDPANGCLFPTGSLAPNIRPRRAFHAAPGKFRWIEAQADRVVVDGQTVFRIDPELVFEQQFNRAGTGHGFIVRQPNDAYAVINGQPQRRFAKVWNLRLSDDGGAWGCLVRTDAGKVFAVVNGQATAVEGLSDAGLEAQFFLAPDGHRWAAASQPPIVDGRPQAGGVIVPGGSQSPSVAFSPDSRSFAYVCIETIVKPDSSAEYHRYVVRDGKRSQEWAEIAPGVVWSPDGKSLAYVARATAGGPWHVVRDDAKWPGCDGVAVDALDRFVLSFSADGKRLAAFVQRGVDWHAVIDGRERPGHGKAPFGAGWAGFAPDGRLVYLARSADGAVAHVEELPPGTNAVPLLRPAPAAAPVRPQDQGWAEMIDLALGRWKSDDGGKRWTVRNGELDASVFGALHSTGEFRDFRVRLEGKFSDTTGAALETRAGRVVLHHLSDGGGDKRTGTLVDVDLGFEPFEGGFLNDPIRPDRWFALDLTVVGRRAVVRVDGKVVSDRRLPERTPEAGTIKLVNINGSALWFRKMAVRESVEADEFDKPLPGR